MGLVQRAVSVMLYGNGTAKQYKQARRSKIFFFYRFLSIFSHSKEWAEKLSLLIEKPPVHVSELQISKEYRNILKFYFYTRRLIAYGGIQDEANTQDSDEENLTSLQPSPSAPEVLNEEDADYSNASEVSENIIIQDSMPTSLSAHSGDCVQVRW